MKVFLSLQLKNTNFTFTGGDSSKAEDKTAMGKLLDNLDSVITGERLDVHVIVDDAAGNSYIQVNNGIVFMFYLVFENITGYLGLNQLFSVVLCVYSC